VPLVLFDAMARRRNGVNFAPSNQIETFASGEPFPLVRDAPRRSPSRPTSANSNAKSRPTSAISTRSARDPLEGVDDATMLAMNTSEVIRVLAESWPGLPKELTKKKSFTMDDAVSECSSDPPEHKEHRKMSTASSNAASPTSRRTNEQEEAVLASVKKDYPSHRSKYASEKFPQDLQAKKPRQALPSRFAAMVIARKMLAASDGTKKQPISPVPWDRANLTNLHWVQSQEVRVELNCKASKARQCLAEAHGEMPALKRKNLQPRPVPRKLLIGPNGLPPNVAIGTSRPATPAPDSRSPSPSPFSERSVGDDSELISMRSASSEPPWATVRRPRSAAVSRGTMRRQMGTGQKARPVSANKSCGPLALENLGVAGFTAESKPVKARNAKGKPAAAIVTSPSSPSKEGRFDAVQKPFAMQWSEQISVDSMTEPSRQYDQQDEGAAVFCKRMSCKLTPSMNEIELLESLSHGADDDGHYDEGPDDEGRASIQKKRLRDGIDGDCVSSRASTIRSLRSSTTDRVEKRATIDIVEPLTFAFQESPESAPGVSIRALQSTPYGTARAIRSFPNALQRQASPEEADEDAEAAAADMDKAEAIDDADAFDSESMMLQTSEYEHPIPPSPYGSSHSPPTGPASTLAATVAGIISQFEHFVPQAGIRALRAASKATSSIGDQACTPEDSTLLPQAGAIEVDSQSAIASGLSKATPSIGDQACTPEDSTLLPQAGAIEVHSQSAIASGLSKATSSIGDSACTPKDSTGTEDEEDEEDEEHDADV